MKTQSKPPCNNSETKARPKFECIGKNELSTGRFVAGDGFGLKQP